MNIKVYFNGNLIQEKTITSFILFYIGYNIIIGANSYIISSVSYDLENDITILGVIQ